MNRGFTVAIDGPVASGKGTMAETLAHKLGGSSVNTGGMYRAVALFCIENNIDTNKEVEVVKILPSIKVELKDEKVYLNGRDVTERIKEPDIAEMSSIVAFYSGVRKDLTGRQRAIAEKGISEGKIIILEGRDIGTRVLPNADIKIFLTANPEVRARRRLKQYAKKEINKSFEEVLSETKHRDEVDSTRHVDPLPLNPEDLGYWVLDDSDQAEEETIKAVMTELRKRQLIND